MTIIMQKTTPIGVAGSLIMRKMLEWGLVKKMKISRIIRYLEEYVDKEGDRDIMKITVEKVKLPALSKLDLLEIEQRTGKLVLLMKEREIIRIST